MAVEEPSIICDRTISGAVRPLLPPYNVGRDVVTQPLTEPATGVPRRHATQARAAPQPDGGAGGVPLELPPRGAQWWRPREGLIAVPASEVQVNLSFVNLRGFSRVKKAESHKFNGSIHPSCLRARGPQVHHY